MARRYDDAIAEYEKAVAIDGTRASAYAWLGHCYRGKGMFRKAIATYQMAIRLGDRSPSLRIFLGSAYAKAGDQRRARAILEELRTGGSYVAPGELAALYTSLGQRERAFALLEEAYALHDEQLQYLMVEPDFDPLRDDPRYGILLQRVGLRN
jgi:tetratricopeptide (TPR) repeat protein